MAEYVRYELNLTEEELTEDLSEAINHDTQKAAGWDFPSRGIWWNCREDVSAST